MEEADLSEWRRVGGCAQAEQPQGHQMQALGLEAAFLGGPRRALSEHASPENRAGRRCLKCLQTLMCYPQRSHKTWGADQPVST